MSLSTQMKCIVLFAAGIVLFIGTGILDLSRSENSRIVMIPAVPEQTAAVSSAVVRYTAAKEEKVSYAMSTLPEHTETVTEAVPVHININTASAEELELLDGIGKHLAEEIVAYRERNGAFRNIEELINVNGIGSKLFQRISGDIYVIDPVYPEENDLPEYRPEDPAEEQFSEESPVENEPSEPELRLEDSVPIDLNTADAETLMLLPYVDEQTAEHLIRIREQIGGFSHVYELLIAEELTQEQVAEILQYVYVEKKTTQPEP